jgi:hypothetical protein
MPESLKEALRSDGTPFIEVSDADIAGGALLNGDGTPKYPILISLASEAVDTTEIDPLLGYVNAGGILFVGSSAFTRNPGGSTRTDFALASAMGLHMVSPDSNLNWYLNNTFSTVADHRLVASFPTGTLTWRMPLDSEEIQLGVSGSHAVHGSHYVFQVAADSDTTVIANGDSGPLLATRSYGKGNFIYHGAAQPLMGHGGYDPAMYAYLIYRHAIEWAFEAANLPIIKLSPWQYDYDAAFIVRHDFENDQASIGSVESSALFENSQTPSVKGDYYFCTGTLRSEMTGTYQSVAIAGLQSAVTNYGATIGSHNGGLKNPVNSSLLIGDFDYWHWGPDEVLDSNLTPTYASGKDYAQASILQSFQDIEGWLSGLDNGRVGCGSATCPRIWTAPYFNSTREASYGILQDLGIVSTSEQKISPFPSWTLSTQITGSRYSHISLPISDWFVNGDMTSGGSALEGHTLGTMEAAVDFYYNLGALINIYGHTPSDGANLQGSYVAYCAAKPAIWATNAVGIYDWWKVRSNIVTTPSYTVTGNTATAQVTITGATDAGTTIEFTIAAVNGTLSQVLVNGSPSIDYRTFGNTIKIHVGSGATSAAVVYTITNPAPTITSLSPTSATAGGPAFTLTVNGTGFVSDSIVNWKGSNRTTAYMSSTQLTAAILAADILSSGTATVTVSNPTHGGGTSSTKNFTINKASQTITVVTHATTTAAYNSQFTVAATASSGLTVTYSSGSPSICTNVGATFTMVSGTGTCVVQYDQAGNATYSAAPQVTDNTIAVKVSQTITVGTHAPASAEYNSQFTVASTATSSLTVAYSTGSPSVCTNSGAVFTMISSSGTCTVQYDQAGNANYNAATRVTESTTAVKSSQTITVGTHAPASAAYNSQFTVASTATSSLTVSYSSGSPSVCTNSGAVFTMLSSSGTCTVQYDQAGNANYNAATQVTESTTAQKATPNVTAWPTASSITFGQTLASSVLSGGTSTVAGSFAFTTPSTAPNAGTAPQSVTFTPTDTGNYNTSTSTVSVTVNKANAIITWPISASTITYGQTLASSVLSGGTSTVAGSFAFTTPSTAPNAGIAPQSVTFTPTDIANYNTAAGTVSVTVNKADQTITFGALAVKVIGAADFAPGATATPSGLTVLYGSSNTGVATIVGGNIHIVSVGTTTITASQPGDANYNAATPVDQGLTVAAATQTITVGTHAPASAVYNSTFNVSATASPSGYTVAITTSGGCSGSGSGSATITMTSGTTACTVKYDQAGDINYAAAQVTETTTAGKASQSITVGTHAPASAAYNTQFTVASTATSSLTVNYSSGSPSICTNVGATFTMVSGTGTCVVQYDQAGDTNYSAATRVTENTTAGKASQTITVGTHAPASAAYNSQFTVASTVNSGLTVTYSSGSPSVCINSGAVFTMISASGTCVVQYDQAGNANYNAATRITENTTAGKAAQTITFNPPTTKNFGDAPFDLSTYVTGSGASGNQVTFVVTSGYGSITGTTLTITGFGAIVITASQTFNANYNAAADVQKTITILPNGDLNGDSIVDITDALKALRIAAGLDTPTASDIAHGDVAPLVNGIRTPDGKIDLSDVVAILRKAVTLPSW